jgi:glycosyltransferase involved in cell wall biosynthesis
MSQGRCVLSTQVGGVVDLLGNKLEVEGALTVWDNGVTVASGDVDGFAAGLEYLIDRPELRGEMGARGRAFVRSRLSKERLIREIEGLYEELAATL